MRKLTREERILLAALAAAFILTTIGLVRAVGGLERFVDGVKDPNSTVGKLWRRVVTGLFLAVTAVLGVAALIAGAPFALTAGLVVYGLYKTGAYAVGSGLLESFLRDVGLVPPVVEGPGATAENLCKDRGGIRSIVETGIGSAVECADGTVHPI